MSRIGLYCSYIEQAKTVVDDTAGGELTPTELFAKRLRELRKRRDWSANRLAERIAQLDPATKLSRGTIAKIEGGVRPVRLDEVFIIAAALSVSPRWLMGSRPDDPWRLRYGTLTADAYEVWRWEDGGAPLSGSNAGDERFFNRVQMDWRAVELLAGHADRLDVLRNLLEMAEIDLERLASENAPNDAKLSDARAVVKDLKAKLHEAQTETPSKWERFRTMIQMNQDYREMHIETDAAIARIARDLGVDPDEMR